MKIKVITPDALHGEAWTAALRAERAFDVALIVRELHTVNVLVNGSRPDLVLVETTAPKDFDALEALAGAHPEIDYVLVGNDQGGYPVCVERARAIELPAFDAIAVPIAHEARTTLEVFVADLGECIAKALARKCKVEEETLLHIAATDAQHFERVVVILRNLSE